MAKSIPASGSCFGALDAHALLSFLQEAAAHTSRDNIMIPQYILDSLLQQDGFGDVYKTSNLVTFLENDGGPVQDGLNIDSFYCVLHVLLQSCPCLAKERGLGLLLGSIRKRSSDVTTPSFYSRRQVSRIAQKVANHCLSTLTKTDAELQTRRWGGQYFLEIMRLSKNMSSSLLHENTDIRKLGTITLEEADFSLRLLAGAVSRQLILSRQNVSVDSFWPVGTSRQSYEGFPCQRINDQWDEIFNHFMDEKRGECSTQAVELLEIEGLAIEFRKGALATVTNNTLTFAIYNDETKFDFIDLDMSSICTTKIRDNVLSVIELNLNDKASVKVNGQVHATDKMVIYFKSFAAASRIQLSIEQRKKGSQNDLAKVVINKDGCARLVIDVKHRVSSATVDLACSDKIGRHSATEISSSSRNIPNASIGDERPRESRRPWSVARLQLPSEGEVIDKSEKYLFQKNALETNITSPSATNKIERTPNWKAVGRNRDNTTVIKTQESEPNIESGLINFTGDEIIPDSLGSIDRKKSAVVNELDEADECQKGERMPRPAGQIELQISHITSSPPSQNHHRLDLLTNDSQIVQTNPAADEAAGLPREQYHLATPKPTRDMAGPEDSVGRDGQNSGNAPMASVGSKLKRPRLKPAGPVTRNSPTNWSLDLSATDNERSQQPQASSRTKTKPKKPITEDSGKLDRPNGNAKLFSEKRRQLHLQPLPLTPKTGSALNKSNGANNARTDASDGKFNVERQAQPLTSGRPSREAAVKAKAKMMMTNRYENEVHDSDALDDPIESSFLVDHKDEVESIEKALTPDPTQERTKGNITREQNTTISSETNQQQAGICDCRTLSDDQILFNAHQDTINVPSTKTRFDNIHAKPLNKSSVSYGHFGPRKEDNQPLGSRPGVSELSKNVAKFISRQQDQATTKQSYENDDQQIRRFTSAGDSINEEVGSNSREKTPKPNAGKETLCPKMTNQPYGDLTQLEFGEKKQSRRAENELNQGLNLTTKNLQVINHNENKRKIPMDSPQKSKSSSICEVTREDFHSHIRDSPPRFSQSQRVDENGSPIPRRIVKPVFRKNFGRLEAIPKTLDDKWDCSDSGDLLSEKITFGSEDTGKHIDSTKQKTNDIQSDSSSELKSDSSSSSEEFEPILPAIQSRRKIIRHASPEASFFWLPRTKRQVQPKEKLDNTLPEARPVKRRIESPKKRKNEFSKKRKVESPKQKYARQKRSSEVDSETETHTTSSYPYTSFSDATTLVEPDTDVEIEWQRALRASQKTSLEIMLDTSRRLMRRLLTEEEGIAGIIDTYKAGCTKLMEQLIEIDVNYLDTYSSRAAPMFDELAASCEGMARRLAVEKEECTTKQPTAKALKSAVNKRKRVQRLIEDTMAGYEVQ